MSLLKILNNYYREICIIILFAALLPFVLWGAAEARRTAQNRVIDWLPQCAERDAFFEIMSYFPEGDILMVSWKGCNWDDPRQLVIASKLLEKPPAYEEPFFTRVMSSRESMLAFQKPPLELSQKAASRRLQGWLVGNDGEGCVVAIASSYGVLHRKETIAYIRQVLRDTLQLPDNDIYLAGTTLDSVAIDEISQQSQRRLLPFFLAICFAFILYAFRSIFAASLIFVIALINEELGPSLVIATGNNIDSISMLIGSLVYVLTISSGVHLVNYYRESIAEYPPEHASYETIRRAFMPCTLAVITTVLGMCSLAVSKMIPIRNFGIFASLALLLGTVLLFCVFFVMTRRFPIKQWQRVRANKVHNDHRVRYNLIWNSISRNVFKIHNLILLICAAAIIFAATGLMFLKTNVTLHGMLSPREKIILDYNQLEHSIGGLIPIEIMLRIPVSPGDVNDSVIDQLYLLDEVANSVRPIEPVDSVVTAMNFCPRFYPKNESTVRAVPWRAALRKILPRYIKQFEENKLLHVIKPTTDGGVTTYLWRLSLRIPAYSTVDYSQLLDAIELAVSGAIKKNDTESLDKTTFVISGGVPLVQQAQKLLMTDLINSFLGAFVMIAVSLVPLVMPQQIRCVGKKFPPASPMFSPFSRWFVVLMRSIFAALLMMVPNVFPCVIAFGFLGWSGMAVDMGSMMTASVAMGIAVDGTLHFLTWFNIGLGKNMSRNTAISYAYRQCATALLQTTIICGLGMLVFALSGFVPIARFASFLCILLWLSLFGDLILLPALLGSPLGKVFEKRDKINHDGTKNAEITVG
ncbi:MAG: MMPL family transporter [Planctomycetaceae bacterium]|jgi:predicted RND superfamily exporter protein|nr:MMPL family transporter [Planctomycetaceae bacterium]